MMRSLLGAVAGLVIGVLLGTGLHYLSFGPTVPSTGWTSYPRITDVLEGEPPVIRQQVSEPGITLTLAVILCGGFGAVVGALVGGTSTILQAFNQHSELRAPAPASVGNPPALESWQIKQGKL